MDVFGVRDRLIEDYREFAGAFVDIHDKAEQICPALRISVPVPDLSDDVVGAIISVEMEREFSTKFRQACIHPEAVSRDLDRMRASLGTAAEVREFTERALRALRADDPSSPDGFTACTCVLPPGPRDALVTGHLEPPPFHVDLPVSVRAQKPADILGVYVYPPGSVSPAR